MPFLTSNAAAGHALQWRRKRVFRLRVGLGRVGSRGQNLWPLTQFQLRFVDATGKSVRERVDRVVVNIRVAYSAILRDSHRLEQRCTLQQWIRVQHPVTFLFTYYFTPLVSASLARALFFLHIVYFAIKYSTRLK